MLGLPTGFLSAQSFYKTSDLFRRGDDNSGAGHLNIIQDPAIDTLIYRYILANENIKKEFTYYGMTGVRIQIYNNSTRNARTESDKVRQEFMDKFPDIISYKLYAEPGYFKIRVGDFRTKTEAMKVFLSVSKEFKEAYFVPDIINFPDPNNK